MKNMRARAPQSSLRGKKPVWAKRTHNPLLELLECRTLLATTKIMPLGDSITQSELPQQSYRYWLWKSLQQSNYDVDFVGGQFGVYGGSPPLTDFDQNHEGHGGYRADQIRDNITSWANANRPDVVLLHIGTNDIWQGQSVNSTSTEIGQTIDRLRAVNSGVVILLAKIIPGSFYNVSSLNNSIQTLASQKNTSQSPVIVVDQASGFNVNSDTYDGVHPNASGEQKMAGKWFSTLTSVLPAPPVGAPTYLSNLTWTSATNGWGPVERDMSNGENGAGDGRTITLNGVTYTKGLGVHANSDVRFNLNGQYSTFATDIGLDDEVGNGGSVRFQVFLDNATTAAYDSGTMTGATATKQISLSVSGNNTLRLVVSDNGDGTASDHADWANARLLTTGTPTQPPAAPTGLSATLAGTQAAPQINLAWNDVAATETGYKVERKTGVNGTWAEIASLGSNATSYVNSTNLAASTTYYYRVYAVNAGGSSGFSNEANATTPATQPPTGTTYLSDLTWTSATNGWGPVERDMSNGENGTGDGRTITLNGVTYPKGLGVHAASDVRFNLAGQYATFITDIGVDDEVGNGGSVRFQIYLDSATTAAYDSGTMTGATATKQVSLDVSGRTTLRLVVTDNGDGAGYDHADWASARLLVAPPVTAPAAPTGLSATVGGTQAAPQIHLAWTDAANNETGYKVERKTGTNGTWAEIASLGAGATSYINNTNVANSTTYYYRVYAYNSGGSSAFSNEANATTPAAPVVVPAAPTNLTATLAGTPSAPQINLVWTDAANNETGYKVERKTGTTGTWSEIASLGANATSYINNTNLLPSTTYYFRVYATNSAGSSGLSNEANATTPAAPVPPPAAPTGLSATLSGTQSAPEINLSWTDVATDETGYKVERKTGVNGTWSEIASLAAGVTSYVNNTNLAAATTYYYRVYAVNAGGASGFSNEANVTTPTAPPPAAPTGLSATLAGTQAAPQVSLAWTDVATNETGYKVERRAGTNGAWTEIASLAANATSYVNNTNVANSTTYYYRVYAVNSGGNSAYSNEASVTTPQPPVSADVFVSDIAWASATNGWGPVEKDKSNGENGTGDGQTLTLNGVTYTKGLGVHANSDIRFNLAGGYTTFLADIGLDDEVGNNGSVRFQVFLDSATTPTYDSGTMTGATATKQVNVNVSGRSTLRLVVTDNGDGAAYDHADWANARLVSGAPVTPPAAPTNLSASYASGSVNLAWTDAATDETGYKVERKAGANGTWGEIASLSANAGNYVDGANLLPGTTYFYRVFAIKNGTPSTFSNEASALIPAPVGVTYLSDLAWVSATNGWGTVERDRSNGEQGAGDGRTISIGGQTYTKGLGIHANSEIVFNLGGAYTSFNSDIGIDDETGGGGSVVFQVWVDGVKVYDSGTVFAGAARSTGAINLTGAQQLRLVVTDAADGNAYDHADWANARLFA